MYVIPVTIDHGICFSHAISAMPPEIIFSEGFSTDQLTNCACLVSMGALNLFLDADADNTALGI